jgi:hypothetical protein
MILKAGKSKIQGLASREASLLFHTMVEGQGGKQVGGRRER